jgi:hypothetical protein
MPYFKVDNSVDVNKVTIRASATSAPNITSGAGAPSHTAPNGSMYLRTNASDADDALYMRIGGAWAPILGETA